MVKPNSLNDCKRKNKRKKKCRSSIAAKRKTSPTLATSAAVMNLRNRPESTLFSHYMRRGFGVRRHVLPVSICSKYSPLQVVNKYSCASIPYKGEVHHGAVYNLEFSPDNKYLVAVCENRAIQLFDPCTHRKVLSVEEAHRHSVNCVTFLDTRVFATCSDDSTIAIWDVRNLKSKVKSLLGHENWVKNINYDPQSNVLISSAFDNTVRTWKINEFYNGDSVSGEKFIHIPFLTRTDLSSDLKKFIIATTTGVLLVIHNVNFEIKSSFSNMADILNKNDDDDEEEDTSWRAMPNRIEYITDFPLDVKPWCIASLQIHPESYNVLSRYTCNDHGQVRGSEWSAVHNIQDVQGPEMTSRLQSFIEEPNHASGLIKEVCYNNTGHVICSPFGNGVRLLTYDNLIEPFPSVHNGSAPRTLHELKYISSHRDPVLTTRFAKHLPILASGCKGGQVAFYQPKF